jgi:hypothetical protein
MSIPPPNDPDQPTRPMIPAEPVYEREQVVDRVVEPEFDPRFALASLEDGLRSVRTALVLLGLVSVAALAIGLYALLRADEADRTDRGGEVSRSQVSRLEDRIDELEAREPAADADSVEKALEEKADADDVTQLQQAVEDLRDQPAEADPETAQAITDLTGRLDELESRVEQLEQQAP